MKDYQREIHRDIPSLGDALRNSLISIKNKGERKTFLSANVLIPVYQVCRNKKHPFDRFFFA
jgi:hypothetical protein